MSDTYCRRCGLELFRTQDGAPWRTVEVRTHDTELCWDGVMLDQLPHELATERPPFAIDDRVVRVGRPELVLVVERCWQVPPTSPRTGAPLPAAGQWKVTVADAADPWRSSRCSDMAAAYELEEVAS